MGSTLAVAMLGLHLIVPIFGLMWLSTIRERRKQERLFIDSVKMLKIVSVSRRRR